MNPKLAKAMEAEAQRISIYLLLEELWTGTEASTWPKQNPSSQVATTVDGTPICAAVPFTCSPWLRQNDENTLELTSVFNTHRKIGTP